MLLSVEGIHGAGKSMLIDSVVKYYNHKIPTLVTSWNSFDSISSYVYKYRLKGYMTDKYTYFLMQLSDFSFRYFSVIEKAIDNKNILVIADRYINTGIVRGIVRGLSKEYVLLAYSFAQKPNLEILLDIDETTSIERRKPRSDSVWMIGMGNVGNNSQFSEDLYKEYLKKSRNLYLDYYDSSYSVIVKEKYHKSEIISLIDRKLFGIK